MNSAQPSCCPLCGEPNDCQLCTPNAYKGPCWCFAVEMPEALLAQVPAALRNKSCVCRKCVQQYHRKQTGGGAPQLARPGEYYFEAGLMIFTAEYHLRRGYCCGNNCRHCPYPKRFYSNPA